jgi:anti-sigma B factor antagonist
MAAAVAENHNLTHRALAIIDHSEPGLALAVEGLARVKADPREFLRIAFDHSARELSRENFAQSIRELQTHRHLLASDTRWPMRGPAAINCNAHAFCKRQVPPQPFLYSRVIIAKPAERLFLVSFSVKIRHRDQVALIDVSGHLTFFEVGALRESIQSLLQAQRKNIILNLSNLVYLDSSGIGELARIYVAVVKHGGAMKVIGLTPKVEEVLKITHLSQVFQEFPDEQSALRSFPAIP